MVAGLPIIATGADGIGRAIATEQLKSATKHLVGRSGGASASVFGEEKHRAAAMSGRLPSASVNSRAQ